MKLSFLYVTEPNCKVYFEENQVIMDDGKGLLTKLPIEILEGIVLIGNANLTTGCQRELLKRGISVTFLASNGQYYGRLESTRHVNILVQRKQFRLGDDEAFILAFAQKIISAKVHNQVVIARRLNRERKNNKIQQVIEDMLKLYKKIPQTSELNQVLGYEGSCAKLYFEALSQAIIPSFAFKGRNKMPPKDPFNSLLSFGYTLLMYEVYSAITNKGLHPYAGLIHKDHHGHPALASDLMEEWRAVLIDSLVLKLLNNEEFTVEDFDHDEQTGGVYLSRNASKKFLKEYEKKIRIKSNYLDGNNTMSFKKAIQYQVNSLTKMIDQRDLDCYQPIYIR